MICKKGQKKTKKKLKILRSKSYNLQFDFRISSGQATLDQLKKLFVIDRTHTHKYHIHKKRRPILKGIKFMLKNLSVGQWCRLNGILLLLLFS